MEPISNETVLSEDDEAENAVLKAQEKNNLAIATCHVEILKRLQRLEKLGGTQDYKCTIIEALKAFGGTLSLAQLGLVLPDHVLLTEARRELNKQGTIEELSEKNRKILQLKSAA